MSDEPEYGSAAWESLRVARSEADHFRQKVERLERDRDALLAAALAIKEMSLERMGFRSYSLSEQKAIDVLLAAIKQVQAESLTAEEQSYRDLAASGGIVDAP